MAGYMLVSLPPMNPLRAPFVAALLALTQPVVSADSNHFTIQELLTSSDSHTIGPWGELIAHSLVLEQPEDRLPTSGVLQNWRRGPVWNFAVETVSEVNQILITAGLRESDISSLLTRCEPVSEDGTTYLQIQPPEEILLRMTNQQRFLLYQNLHPRVKENPYFLPVTLPPGGMRSLTSVPSGVPEQIVSLVDRMSFTIGFTRKFSDISFIFQKIPDPADQRRFLKTLGREPSFSLELKFSEESDLYAIETYWSARGRNREILPILESAFKTSGVDALDVVHLLPPTPRKLLHTYPTSFGDGIADDLPDCFWTSFGFFADNPPERHLDFVGHIFSERYESVSAPLQLGDLLLISDHKTGDWLHACNYLAGEFVFTKNGMSPGRPWVIDRLANITAEYRTVETVRVTSYRLKPQFQR